MSLSRTSSEPHGVSRRTSVAVIKQYSAFLALGIIILIFGVLTRGAFISTRNLINLINQTGYIAVLSVGMTLVLIVRQIDLSVGFLAGSVGAFTALAVESWGIPSPIALSLGLTFGLASGLAQGAIIAYLRVPAIVATLAGLLIFRGVLFFLTNVSGTIIVSDPFFTGIGNEQIPDIPVSLPGALSGVHMVSLVLGLLFLIGYLIDRQRGLHQLGLEGAAGRRRAAFTMARNVGAVGLGAVIVWILATGRGFSWTFLIMMSVTLIFSFLMNNTLMGKQIYALGQREELAARLGIPTRKVLLFVFGCMGFLAALSGILFTARIKSATPQAGTLFELDAIAAAYIGGVSVKGGFGKVSHSVLGAFVYTSLVNGMTLTGTDQSLQFVIRAAVLLAAVVFEILSNRYLERRKADA